jgi:hypothetical protein
MTKKLEDMLNMSDNKDIVEPKKDKKQQAIVDQQDTFRDI